MKVLLASEEITNRPREGTLVFLMHLSRFLQKESELTVLHALGEPDPDLRSLRHLSPKTFLTMRLIRRLGSERFDVVIYVPRGGLTTWGLLRGAALKTLSKCSTILITLQERPGASLNPFLSLIARPDLVLSPVEAVRERCDQEGVETGFIAPGFDDRLFRPASPDARAALRAKYRLPADRFLLLHVGHVRETRNLEVLLRYRDWGADVQPVVKAGAVDPAWAHRLRMAGIIVIDEYLHDVHELYQACDAYFFPVACRGGAVELPLSIVEACACNLPVLTTRFGVVDRAMREGDGLLFFERVSEIAGSIAALRRARPATAAKVRELSWEKVFRAHLLPSMAALVSDARRVDGH